MLNERPGAKRCWKTSEVLWLRERSGPNTGAGMDPLVLCIPVTLAASCGFMLPMATPPNAIAFASGHLKIGDMVKAGWWLDVVSIVVVALAAKLFLPLVF